MGESEEPDDYLHAELTGRIINAAIAVHSELGPGYLEKIYENALVYELSTRGLSVRQQVSYPVSYRGRQVGLHVLDLVVEEKVYVELKCKQTTALETAQVLSGLRASGMAIGLLINFRTHRLKDGIKRVVLT